MEIAEKYNIKTYSDLKAISNQLVFGAEYDFFLSGKMDMMLFVTLWFHIQKDHGHGYWIEISGNQ